MARLTEEEKEILRKAEEIKQRMEEDVDLLPDDFGEPIKKNQNVNTNLEQENFVGYEEVADEEIIEKAIDENTTVKEENEESMKKQSLYQEERIVAKKDEIQPDNKEVLKGEN